MSPIQTTQDVFVLLNGPETSYPVLKFGNILHISNRDMA